MEKHGINIDGLTKAQALQLYNELASRHGRADKVSKESLTDDEIIVWDAINSITGRPVAIGPVLEKTGKSYTRASFGDDAEYVMTWIDQGCVQPLSRVQRQSIVSTGFDCLRRRMSRMSVPVTPKTLLQQLNSIPSLLDSAFPGYQRAKILDRIAAVAD